MVKLAKRELCDLHLRDAPAPNAQIIPALGPKVCRYYLHWAMWIPREFRLPKTHLSPCLSQSLRGLARAKYTTIVCHIVVSCYRIQMRSASEEPVIRLGAWFLGKTLPKQPRKAHLNNSNIHSDNPHGHFFRTFRRACAHHAHQEMNTGNP